MNKVIGHYKAICHYCGGKTLIQEREGGRLKVRDCCKHFERVYKEGGKIIVRFSVVRDVEAVREDEGNKYDGQEISVDGAYIKWREKGRK